MVEGKINARNIARSDSQMEDSIFVQSLFLYVSPMSDEVFHQFSVLRVRAKEMQWRLAIE